MRANGDGSVTYTIPMRNIILKGDTTIRGDVKADVIMRSDGKKRYDLTVVGNVSAMSISVHNLRATGNIKVEGWLRASGEVASSEGNISAYGIEAGLDSVSAPAGRISVEKREALTE